MSGPRAGVADRQVALTPRGWSLLGAAVGLVLGGYVLGTEEMIVLGCAAVALLGAVLVRLTVAAPPPLHATRRVRPTRLHVGSEGRIDLLVEHHGHHVAPLLTATDAFDEGRRAARFLVPPLAPGATARAAYRVPTRRRGRYVVGPLTLAAGDAFGLARRTLPAAGTAEVLVRPRVYDIAPPVATGSRVAHESDDARTRALPTELGGDFLTLRDYEVGDDLRRVHWRSTARTGALMIRQDETRWRSRAAVVLDVRPDHHDDASFELAVEAAASVVTRLVRLQRKVELVTSAGVSLGVGGDPRRDVVDHLATVGPDADDRLASVLGGLRAHRRVDLVVLVLGSPSANGARDLAGLGGIDVVVVLTHADDAASAPTGTSTPLPPGIVTVDARGGDFVDAWNRVFTGAPRRGGMAAGNPSGADAGPWRPTDSAPVDPQEGSGTWGRARASSPRWRSRR